MSVNLEQNVCMYEQQHYVYPSTILNASSTTLNEPSTTLRVTWTTNHVTSTTLNLISTTLHLPRTTLHVPRTTLHASRTTLHVNSTTIHVYSTTLNVCIPYIQHYKYLWNTKCIQNKLHTTTFHVHEPSAILLVPTQDYILHVLQCINTST